MEDKFALSASMLWDAGAHLIEVHCAHGFLLNQFISPASNHRKDEYGGDLRNRLRIALNILKKIKERVDKRLIISCRISSEELVEDGTTLDQSCEIASTLLQNGADIIHVSGGVGYASGPMLNAISQGTWVKNAAVIKKHIKGPVIAVGGINSLRRAEEILDSGAADFVAMARPLVADPELVSKSLAGREDDVNTCVDCNSCYVIVSPEFPPISCAQRPVVS
ncbi:MAG: tRNA-dihydrouridine synthase, partial [Candidatus Lindowbacteria bacterium]|nr:tRNA-dihydrouridine synthase [Candidatus Lindowbacteria bacterium]